MIDIALLKSIAQKATQGQWWIDSHGHTLSALGPLKVICSFDHGNRPAIRHADTGNLSHWENDNDANLIAMCGPENILQLIDKIEKLELENKVLKDKLSEHGEYLI